MFQSLINNFTMLTTFLFFGNLARSKYLDSREDAKVLNEWIMGVALGLLGVVLMYFSFPINDKWITDFRQLPILIAACLCGFGGGSITAIIIVCYRLFFFHSDMMVSILALLNVIITLVVGVVFLHRLQFKLRNWIAALLITMFFVSVSFHIASVDFTFKTIVIFNAVFMVCGLFTRSMLQYLKRTDDYLWLMQEHAERDFLTGLYNSRAFDAVMQKTIETTSTEQCKFSVLMLDIDHFKYVNDTYGHPAGDAVLATLADILKKQFRSEDHVARKGGEEFIVIVNRHNSTEVQAIAEQLRHNVEKYKFILQGNGTIHITISIGIASYPEVESDKLIDTADQALYLAKQSGRNRVCLFSDLEERR